MHSTKHLAGLIAATAMVTACNQPAEAPEDIEAGIIADAIADTEAEIVPVPIKPADSDQLKSDLAVIEASCRAMGNASDALCTCLENQARELNADELALTVAQLTGDAERADAVRPKLDMIGLSRGGGFMTQAPYACEE